MTIQETASLIQLWGRNMSFIGLTWPEEEEEEEEDSERNAFQNRQSVVPYLSDILKSELHTNSCYISMRIILLKTKIASSYLVS